MELWSEKIQEIYEVDLYKFGIALIEFLVGLELLRDLALLPTDYAAMIMKRWLNRSTTLRKLGFELNQAFIHHDYATRSYLTFNKEATEKYNEWD